MAPLWMRSTCSGRAARPARRGSAGSSMAAGGWRRCRRACGCRRARRSGGRGAGLVRKRRRALLASFPLAVRASASTGRDAALDSGAKPHAAASKSESPRGSDLIATSANPGTTRRKSIRLKSQRGLLRWPACMLGYPPRGRAGKREGSAADAAPASARKPQPPAGDRQGEAGMSSSHEFEGRLHPKAKEAFDLMERGRLSRREFIRVAALTGVAAGAAYAMAGLPAPAFAQAGTMPVRRRSERQEGRHPAGRHAGPEDGGPGELSTGRRGPTRRARSSNTWSSPIRTTSPIRCWRRAGKPPTT